MAACAKPRQANIQPLDEEQLQLAIQESDRPYVVVNFYTSQCRPSSKEIPELMELQASQDRKANIIFVSMDKQQEIAGSLTAFLQSLEAVFPAYHMDRPQAESFVKSIHPHWKGDTPLNLIFAREGQRLVEATGMTDPQEIYMIIHKDLSFGS